MTPTVSRNCCRETSEERCASTTAPLQRPRHTNWSNVTPSRRTVSLSTQHWNRHASAIMCRRKRSAANLKLRLAEPAPYPLPLAAGVYAESVQDLFGQVSADHSAMPAPGATIAMLERTQNAGSSCVKNCSERGKKQFRVPAASASLKMFRPCSDEKGMQGGFGRGFR